MKVIAVNKKAYFDYFVEERIECGIVLEGGEVKSIRAGNVSLKESFALLRGGELWLKNAHIAPYDKATAFTKHDSRRDRKLLATRGELNKLAGKVNQKGYTLMPLQMYFKGSMVKLEIGLCRGKQLHDKRRTIADRESERSAQRAIKEYN